ncbi:MAG TPA: hypothetical protein VGM88_13215 [Kofleriaceae bacterium]|jgi:hypothetical protein
MPRSLVVLLALVAAPGLAAAAPAAWCKDLSTTTATLYPNDLTDLTSPDLEAATQAVVKASCARTVDDKFVAQITSARDALTKRLDLHADDWVDVVAWMNHNTNFDPPEITVKSLAALSPVEQYVAEDIDYKNSVGGAADDYMYYMDALGAKATETARAFFVLWCAKDAGDNNVSKWGVCQGDITAFDLRKLSAELHADTAHAGAARFWIRVHAFKIPEAVAHVAEQKKKLVASDAAYQKYFDAAAAGAAEWTRTVGSNTKLLALVEQMDSATLFHSRKLLDGCDEATTAALGDAISTLPASSFKGMNDKHDDMRHSFVFQVGPLLANTPAVNLALNAYISCHPDSSIAKHFGWYMLQTPGSRGPRGAALGAMQRVKAAFDDTTKKAPPMLGFYARPYSGYTDNLNSAGGGVKSLAPKGDKVMVAFDKTSITTQDCVKSHETDRIARIENGNVYYEVICDKTAPVKHDTTWPDQGISAAFAKVLKPGIVFSAADDAVIATWPKGAGLPNWVLFGTVK